MSTRSLGLSLPLFLALAVGCSSPTKPSAPAATAPTASLQSAVNMSLSSVTASYNGMRSGSRTLTLAPEGPEGAGVPSVVGLTVQCTPSGSSCSTQFNESFGPITAACTTGGSSTNSGTLTGVLQGNATSVSGTLNMSSRFSLADCSQGGAVVNSNPSIGTSGTVFITGQRTRLNFTMSGGFVATNPPGTPAFRVSCVFNGALLQWDDITGNWANSGSVDCNNGVSFKL